MLGAAQVVARSHILVALDQVVFVGDVQRGQHGQARRIHGVGLFRHRPHLAVHVLSQFENVFRVRAAEIVGLVENLDPDSVIARDP